MCFAFTVFATEAAGTSGTEVVNAISRLGSIIISIVRAVGAIAVLYGLLQVGMSMPSHDTTQRLVGFLCIAGGVIILFGPEIVEFIAPGSLAGMK